MYGTKEIKEANKSIDLINTIKIKENILKYRENLIWGDQKKHKVVVKKGRNNLRSFDGIKLTKISLFINVNEISSREEINDLISGLEILKYSLERK